MDLLTTSLLQDGMSPGCIIVSVASSIEKLASTVFEADKQIDPIYTLRIKGWNQLGKEFQRFEQSKNVDWLMKISNVS